MSRALTGSRWQEQDGRFGFSCPAERGSPKRRQALFASIEERERWARAAIAAVKAGQAVPDPRPFQAPAVSALEEGLSFGALADRWYSVHHDDLRRAGADRASEVRRLLDDVIKPFFDAQIRSAEDITQDLLVCFYNRYRANELVAPGSDARLPHGQQQPQPMEPDVRLNLKEAATACGVSLSTVKRAIQGVN